jgi:hypothetical protein
MRTHLLPRHNGSNAHLHPIRACNSHKRCACLLLVSGLRTPSNLSTGRPLLARYC